MLKGRKRKKRTYRKKNRSVFKGLFLMAAGVVVLFFVTVAVLAKQPEPAPTGTSVDSREEFIEAVADEAVKFQEEYGITPSVTIAQAILESNWGQSGLAQNEQNYFGIKGSADSPQYQTQEYEEDWVEREAGFRSYASLEESVEDYAQLLAEGTGWNQDLYQAVIGADHYEEAARALQEAGYATDPDYSNKVISLIERHELDRYD